RRRHTRCYRDWSSDVCSSDLEFGYDEQIGGVAAAGALHMIHMNRATLDGGQRILAVAEFVDRIGMQVNCEIVPVRGPQGCVDDEIGRASCRERGEVLGSGR